MKITFEKLTRELERDIRNQVVIDQMKQLTRGGKFMVRVRQVNWWLIGSVLFSLLAWAIALTWATMVYADDRPACPTPGEACKILYLNAQEERLLTGQNGILDTAAQGRQIDLGGFAVYFKSKIATAPAGQVMPVPPPTPPKVDSGVPESVKPN